MEKELLLKTIVTTLDDKKAQLVFAHCPSQDGVGLAVYNRLLRAAAFDVVKL